MCGIFGIYNQNKARIINELVYRLSLLQHRGKDGVGIAYILENDLTKTIKCIKRPGLVKETFKDYFNYYETNCCIGHLKYSTSGNSVNKDPHTGKPKLSISEMQPIIHNDHILGANHEHNIMLVHNGNIPSIKEFDTQFIFNMIINSNKSIETTLINIMNKIPAAYCFLIIVNDMMYVMRDRYGTRPLSMGILNNSYNINSICISSETRALENCENIQEIPPGVIMRFDKTGYTTIYNHPKSVNGICALEIIYFMNPRSYINGILIETIREKLGKIMADKETLIPSNSDYVVVGVPKSGIIYAKSYAKNLGLSYEQLIEKRDNCENGEDRTFILINDMERQKACKKKFKFISKKIKGKKIIIVDDSIVRGTIINYIVLCFKLCGAEEIHIRIPSPPVVDRCQFGIAIKSKEELIMYNRNVEDVKTYLKVNSLKYLSVNDLTMFPKDCYKEYFGCEIDKAMVKLNIGLNINEQTQTSF